MCPIGPAIISRAGGSVLTAARLSRTVLDGRIGKSPLHLAAANGQIVGDRFGLNQFDMRIGKSQSPISVAAAHLLGRFSGNVMEGTFSGGRSTIGDVKLLISDAAGRWRFANSRLSLNGALNLSDRSEQPRFPATTCAATTSASRWQATTSALAARSSIRARAFASQT